MPCIKLKNKPTNQLNSKLIQYRNFKRAQDLWQSYFEHMLNLALAYYATLSYNSLNAQAHNVHSTLLYFVCSVHLNAHMHTHAIDEENVNLWTIQWNTVCWYIIYILIALLRAVFRHIVLYFTPEIMCILDSLENYTTETPKRQNSTAL